MIVLLAVVAAACGASPLHGTQPAHRSGYVPIDEDLRLYYRVYGKGFNRDAAFHRDVPDFDDWRMGQAGFRTDWDGRHGCSWFPDLQVQLESHRQFPGSPACRWQNVRLLSLHNCQPMLQPQQRGIRAKPCLQLTP